MKQYVHFLMPFYSNQIAILLKSRCKITQFAQSDKQIPDFNKSFIIRQPPSPGMGKEEVKGEVKMEVKGEVKMGENVKVKALCSPPVVAHSSLVIRHSSFIISH